MDIDDLAEEAQRKLDTVILAEFRKEFAAYHSERIQHLAGCPDAEAKVTGGGDGFYGCETGCEYVELAALISCPHGYTFDYEYAQFGELAWLIERMDAV